jgi:hypothetical protein
MYKSSDIDHELTDDVIPDDFVKIIYDLINDILFTFPEFKEKLHIDLYNIKESKDESSIINVYNHIKTVFPERFFDILYKNEEMFKSSEINTEFLPGIDFKELWSDDISSKTKVVIWKYLQVILFSVIGKVNSEDSFGDTTKLFEAINQDELKNKLEETMDNLQNMMDDSNIPVSGAEHLPNPEDIHDHINSLLDGKLGKLAKEIAAETADELNVNAGDASSVNDVFKNLFKNPAQLMGLIKNVGGKLDNKIKSGEITESELMQEASELLTKMKDMPGMGDIQSMLKKMGMSSPGGKVNLDAMENALNQNLKRAQMKERILKKGEQRREEKEKQQGLAKLPVQAPLTNVELEQLVFSIEGEKPEKTMRENGEKKSKSNKKKKGKKEKINN